MNDRKVAIITGGSRGIGKAIAIELAKEKINVIINYVSNTDAALETVTLIKDAGGEAECFKGSVCDSKFVHEMVSAVVNKYKKVDILINNAGIIKDGMLFMMKEQDWKDVIDVNLGGTLTCTSIVLKSMAKNGYGRIVNISSTGGLTGAPRQSNYATSKAAIIGFTRSLAKEVAGNNITVNAIVAGYIETEMLKKISSRTLETYKETIPLKRFGKPSDISSAVSFLVSDKANYITGQLFIIDGGVSIV